MAAIELSDDMDPRTDDAPSLSAAGGAKYKLMSPAKLPISRSACLTIPPGLSPSSFLESPVFLSNMKAEPSPTTGTFFMAHMMTQGSLGSASHTNICSSGARNSSSFEFKPHPTSNMAITDPSYPNSQPFPLAPLVKSESAANSNELTLSAPTSMAGSGASQPADGDSGELTQRNHLNSGVQSAQFDPKVNGASVVSSDDGYNWRKYGQKHVKGSEFPRSYYKCTHPNCEVKKLFERSHDGQITEIIYKGSHDHPKPQPNRRYNSGSIVPIQEERSDKFSSIARRDDKSPGMYALTSTNDPNSTPDQSPINTNDENAETMGNRMNDDMDDDDSFSKRRKMEMGGIEVTPVVKPIREPRVVVQTLSEVDILDDGYRWRKYGQKVVRGNPNPRSYYKCTNTGCPVRKHVERASHDPKAVITTYEGKHNHDVPTARNNSHEMAGPMGPGRMRQEETDSISLDLGVGISSAENRSSERLHELQDGQNRNPGFPAYYGILNNGLNPFGTRENPSSYPYPQNMGRILTGP